MVHRRSPEQLRLRRLRGTGLGFVDASSDTVAVHVPRHLVRRARCMLRSLELHDCHNQEAGYPHHYARDAALHAGLAEGVLRGALRVHRTANRAKHQWAERRSAHGGEIRKLYLADLLALPDGWDSASTASGCSSSSSAPSVGFPPLAWLHPGSVAPRAEGREPRLPDRLPVPPAAGLRPVLAEEGSAARGQDPVLCHSGDLRSFAGCVRADLACGYSVLRPERADRGAAAGQEVPVPAVPAPDRGEGSLGRRWWFARQCIASKWLADVATGSSSSTLPAPGERPLSPLAGVSVLPEAAWVPRSLPNDPGEGRLFSASDAELGFSFSTPSRSGWRINMDFEAWGDKSASPWVRDASVRP
mmetsp:Transcript_15607/g.41578  ORF Transcript_15607/g.41578 Transcript_15607/m.41578 type:complete len:359 (+) Transcript_15607:91-1167(+)